MTGNELKAIEERARAASPGPWRVGSVDTDRIFIPHPNGIAGPSGERVLLIANQHFDHARDLAFIAQAREDVPALVAEVRRLQAERLPIALEMAARADERERCAQACDAVAVRHGRGEAAFGADECTEAVRKLGDGQPVESALRQVREAKTELLRLIGRSSLQPIVLTDLQGLAALLDGRKEATCDHRYVTARVPVDDPSSATVRCGGCGAEVPGLKVEIWKAREPPPPTPIPGNGIPLGWELGGLLGLRRKAVGQEPQIQPTPTPCPCGHPSDKHIECIDTTDATGCVVEGCDCERYRGRL